LLLSSLSCVAADMFFVIGQAPGRWRADEPTMFSTSPANKAAALSDATIAASQRVSAVAVSAKCDDSCQLGNVQYGPIASFARKWASLSSDPAYFVVRTKADTGLVSNADAKKTVGTWSSFEDKSTAGVYQAALADFKAAQRRVAASSDRLDKSYVIWIAGEQDAAAGVSASAYKNKLRDLWSQLNRDLNQSDGNKPFDALLVVAPGYFRGYFADYQTTIKGNRDKLNAVVQGLEDAAAKDDIVLISQAQRVFGAACPNGKSSPSCESGDTVAAMNEALGVDMARNAFTYHSTGLRALQPSSCASKPEICGATVDVYRWIAGDSIDAASTFSVDPKEFDASNYQFAGVRFQLFQEAAPGRVALNRAQTGKAKDGLVSVDSSGKKAGTGTTLGYCYSQASGNATHPLLSLVLKDSQVVTRSAVEAAALKALGFSEPKTLCFVS